MVAYGLWFSSAKDLDEIQIGSAPTRALNTGGVGDFRPLSHYTSETVQNRDIVTIVG